MMQRRDHIQQLDFSLRFRQFPSYRHFDRKCLVYYHGTLLPKARWAKKIAYFQALLYSVLRQLCPSEISEQKHTNTTNIHFNSPGKDKSLKEHIKDVL